MLVIGIIVEYNPFHNGHLYQIMKIREMNPDCRIVVVLGGNFLERGEASIINKWDKTALALNYVDLVVELPFFFATQAADVFARGAINILKNLNIDTIVFGSETNNLDSLKEMVDIQLHNPNYQILVKDYLSTGENYPTSMAKALQDISGNRIEKPNDLLGLSYLKEMVNQEVKFTASTIARTNDYHDLSLNSTIVSASSIRNALKNKLDISEYIPSITAKFLTNPIFDDAYFNLIKYKIMTSPDLSIYQTVDEGIDARLKKYIITTSSLDEFIKKVKTKRYTYNKIRRMLTHILVGLTKEEASKYTYPTYIRVLGFNQYGQSILKKAKSTAVIPIITKYIKSDMLELELRATVAYASVLDSKKAQDLIEAEYKHKVIVVKQ